MFLSEAEAMELAKARHKLKTCYAGQGWVICPYRPGATFSDGHWVPPPVKRWLSCDGEICQHHHLPIIVKAHVPCLVVKKPYRAKDCPVMALDKELGFRAENWSQKIFELTAACLPAFAKPSAPDQLAIVYRDSDARNGEVSFRWLDSFLRGVPPSIAHFEVKQMLPAIIGGKLRNAVVQTPLDKPHATGIAHNSNSRNDCNGSDDFDGVPPPLFGVPNGSQHRKAGG